MDYGVHARDCAVTLSAAAALGGAFEAIPT